jgi:hypothetical protein
MAGVMQAGLIVGDMRGVLRISFGVWFIQQEEFSLRFHVQILPSGCSVCVLTEMHDLLDSSTLGTVFNNNQKYFWALAKLAR